MEVKDENQKDQTFLNRNEPFVDLQQFRCVCRRRTGAR